MEEELEAEKRAKTTALQQKKKADAEIARVQTDVENLTRAKEDLGRQLRKASGTVKELQQSVIDLQAQRDNAVVQSKDFEKK